MRARHEKYITCLALLQTHPYYSPGAKPVAGAPLGTVVLEPVGVGVAVELCVGVAVAAVVGVAV